ncbi:MULTISPECIES: DNA cytosine methyltransferase [Enterococcus]|uniref:DNA cytosine methyltransferase n=1 Tax=Enterococcus TaxID=1350 RepID=UPI000C788B67|nr:DNA cytosine methyltransferase [Enterococcus sp. CR-Ec1]AUJ87191.1 modification methylase NmeDIP [Enterococcus sp. CR-Ec1]
MNSQKKVSIFSFFSGSGFLDLGFEKTGYNIELVNEISAPFLEVYSYSRDKMNLPLPRFGYQNLDINEYFNGQRENLIKHIKEVKKENRVLGFIGGPPCPDFSVGGKNKGKDGENGKLSMSYVDLIIDMKPDFFLFENVKGLWKTKRHREFYEELKLKLQSAGYCTTERLTNSLEFGVPQDRERIFLFGVQKKLLCEEHYNFHEISDFPWRKYAQYEMDEIRNIDWPNVNDFQPNEFTICPENCIPELTVEYWFNKNEVYNHPNAHDHFRPRAGLAKMQAISEGDVGKKSYKRLHRWRYSPTAAYGNNEVHLHPYKIRRISAAEALAIQSLPSDFELPHDMSLSNMFKTIGNGVPFLLSKGIAQTIMDYLLDNKII